MNSNKKKKKLHVKHKKPFRVILSSFEETHTHTHTFKNLPVSLVRWNFIPELLLELVCIVFVFHVRWN